MTQSDAFLTQFSKEMLPLEALYPYRSSIEGNISSIDGHRGVKIWIWGVQRVYISDAKKAEGSYSNPKKSGSHA